MNRFMCIILGLLILGLGALWAQTGISSADLKTLVTQDSGYIKTALAKTNLEKDPKSQKKIRAATLMIAHYAQSGISKDNPKNAALATLRDSALAVRTAVKDGKFGDARKLAEKLALDAPVNEAVKIEPVALGKLEDVDLVMKQFASARMGGFGLEDYLIDLKDLKENPGADDVEKIRTFARKLSLIATLSAVQTPGELNNKKTQAKWELFAKDMDLSSTALAKAAESKNAAEISKAAQKVSDTCVKCHDVYR